MQYEPICIHFRVTLAFMQMSDTRLSLQPSLIKGTLLQCSFFVIIPVGRVFIADLPFRSGKKLGKILSNQYQP